MKPGKLIDFPGFLITKQSFFWTVHFLNKIVLPFIHSIQADVIVFYSFQMTYPDMPEVGVRLAGLF